MIENTTPMLKQYFATKADYPDAVLLYRLGDFYEMFLDDAEKCSRVLDIQLTARNAGNGKKVPMCGIPFHSSQVDIDKLIEKRVWLKSGANIIIEQLETMTVIDVNSGKNISKMAMYLSELFWG